MAALLFAGAERQKQKTLKTPCAFCSAGPWQSAARVQLRLHSELPGQQRPLIQVQSSQITPGLRLCIGEPCMSLLRSCLQGEKPRFSVAVPGWCLSAHKLPQTTYLKWGPTSSAVPSRLNQSGSAHRLLSPWQSLAGSGTDAAKCCGNCADSCGGSLVIVKGTLASGRAGPGFHPPEEIILFNFWTPS